MIYRTRSRFGRMPGIASRLHSGRRMMQGIGEGDCIRLRDENGNVWLGTGSLEQDNTVRYRFRDAQGRYITGVGDAWGVILRDETGTTWRGFVD